MQLIRCKQCGQPHQEAYTSDPAREKVCWPCRFKMGNQPEPQPAPQPDFTTKEVVPV